MFSRVSDVTNHTYNNSASGVDFFSQMSAWILWICFLIAAFIILLLVGTILNVLVKFKNKGLDYSHSLTLNFLIPCKNVTSSPEL